MLLTRTNLFIPIFLKLDDSTAIGLLIFSTQMDGDDFRKPTLLACDDFTRINFLVPIFLKRLFLHWLDDKAFGDKILADVMFSFSLDDPGDENFSGMTFGAFAELDEVICIAVGVVNAEVEAVIEWNFLGLRKIFLLSISFLMFSSYALVIKGSWK